METEFLEEIEDDVKWKKQNLLFVPHHGRKSGRVPTSILEKIDPDIIIIGEGPSVHMHYYDGYNTITQNRAKDIWFECDDDWVDVYVSSDTYSVNFLVDRDLYWSGRNYIGSLQV